MTRWTGKLKSRWHRLSRVTQIALLVLALLLIAFRLALPSLVERYVNRKLSSLPSYNGHVGEVDIHLYRGAYSIYNIQIVKKTGEVSVPFFSARVVDLSVQWRELFHRALVCEIEVQEGKLNFVKGETAATSQTKVDKDWTKVVQDLFPFKINRFSFSDSEVWFRDVTTQPKVDVFITNLFLVGTNFNNSRQVVTNLPAGVFAHGRSLGNGALKVQMHLSPFAAKPTFNFAAELREMDLVSLNEMLRAYAKVDVSRGRMSIFSEIAAHNGNFEGYVTPLLEDIKLVDLKQDKNPVKLVWESFVAALVHLFKNHPKDRFGTKIPIHGSFDNPQVSVWAAFGNVFHNFLFAFPAAVEGSVTPENLNKMQEKKPKKK